MKICRVTEADLQEIQELQYLAYQSEAKLFNSQDIPPLKQTLEEIRGEFQKGIILKAVEVEVEGEADVDVEDNEKVIGSVRAYVDEGTVFIGKLMVHPKMQGKGIGTKLLYEIEKECPASRYELFTSTKSIKNIALYEKIGYMAFKEKQISEKLKFVYLQKYVRE